MVIEYIRYVVPSARAEEFEEAYRRATRVLRADEHCMSVEVSRGVEEPEHCIVRIEWDSIEGHERGFRGGPAFAEFFAAVKPFLEQIVEMKHYRLVVQ
ncbi:MAG TPA: antibiotic biosynthesis monooxygenase [Galbitalea sp.]|jgi:quinol monooxygenase YgiN|nr:antibiotic biosynthesis monooxygenase [Galbitalea sp.]